MAYDYEICVNCHLIMGGSSIFQLILMFVRVKTVPVCETGYIQKSCLCQTLIKHHAPSYLFHVIHLIILFCIVMHDVSSLVCPCSCFLASSRYLGK